MVAGRLGTARSLGAASSTGGSGSPRPARHVSPGAMLPTPRGVHCHRAVSAEREIVIGPVGLERDRASVPDPDALLRLRAAAAVQRRDTCRTVLGAVTRLSCVATDEALLLCSLPEGHSRFAGNGRLWMPGQPRTASRLHDARLMRVRHNRAADGCAWATLPSKNAALVHLQPSTLPITTHLTWRMQ